MSEAHGNTRENLERYVPGTRAENSDHGFERLVILLMGFTGHGKSSLINSCICMMTNTVYRNMAGAGKYVGGMTTKRTQHKLTNTILISENRGFGNMKPEEILEVCAQLRHLRHEEDVNWEKDISEETLRCIPLSYNPPKDFILPVIVHSCLYRLNENEEKSMRELITKCHQIIGIPPVVVITNVGPANNRSENVATIDEMFGEMGCTRRICLENYTENNNTRRPEIDNQFFGFLSVCTNEAEHAIQQRGGLDPHQIFAKHVADQIKEENKVNIGKMKEELDKTKRELEKERKKCSII